LAVDGDGAVEGVVAQRLVVHVGTSLAAAAHDAHEVSIPPYHHAGRCYVGLEGQGQAGGHSVGDFAYASAGVAVDAGSSLGERHRVSDASLVTEAVDGAVGARVEDDEHRHPQAPGLVAVGAASHVVAPIVRRGPWRTDVGLRRQPDRTAGRGNAAGRESYGSY
jgi:hypothetical protein